MSKQKETRDFSKSTRDKLEAVGVRMVHDERLDERIEAIAKMRKLLRAPLTKTTALDKIEELETRLYDLDEFLRKNAIPYCRAGTEARFAKALKSWEKLIRYATEGINTQKSCITETQQKGNGNKEHEKFMDFLEKSTMPEEEKEKGKELLQLVMESQQSHSTFATFDQQELVNMLQSFLEVEIFPYGLMISDIGYQSRDVSPAFSLVAPTQQPMWGMPGQNAPPKKEDVAGQMLWNEYVQQMDRRLQRLEKEKPEETE